MAWRRRGGPVLLATVLAAVSALHAERACAVDPIPEPDAIFFGVVSGVPAGQVLQIWIEKAPSRILDRAPLGADGSFVLRAPIVNTVNGGAEPPGSVQVGAGLTLVISDVPQGSFAVAARGTIYELNLRYAATAPVPLPVLTPMDVTGSTGPTSTPTGPTPTWTPVTPGSPTITVAYTPTKTPIPTPTGSPTNTPSASPTPTAIPCDGDCDGSGQVLVPEIIILVNIALGTADVSACPKGIPSNATTVSVTLLIRAVNSALNDCPKG